MPGLRFFLPVAIVLASAAALIASTMTSRADNNIVAHSFTNTTVASASGLIAREPSFFGAHYSGIRVSENPPGCPTPDIIESYDSTVVMLPGTPTGPLVPVTFTRRVFALDWGTPCVDLGETVIVEVGGGERSGYVGQFTADSPELEPLPFSVSANVLRVDCNVGFPGIQSGCTVPPGGVIEAGIVLRTGDFAVSLGSFDLHPMLTGDIDAVTPLPASLDPLDSNPDFNQAALSGSWSCTAIPDVISELSCASGGSGPTLAAHTDTLIAVMRYDVTGSTGEIFVTANGSLVDNGGQPIQTGLPGRGRILIEDDVPSTPIPAGISVGGVFTPTTTLTPTTATATPPPLIAHIQLDCDTTTAGVQDTCVYSTGVRKIDVAFVIENVSGYDHPIAAFNFLLHNPDLSRLSPPPGIDLNLNGNPDFVDFGGGPWFCNAPPPDPLNGGPLGGDGPGTSASLLGCFTTAPGPILGNGDSVVLAVTHYDVPASAQPGVVSLTTSFVGAGDNFGVPFRSSTPCPIPASSGCPTATIIFVAPEVEKIPEGNANNVDLTVPAANLWICAAGPCDGPGEGELIVFEYATNVQTGDQDGDTIADGLGAYEFSVEYDNFVIASLNAQDVVFNPGPIAPYPGGADGAADGEGASRAPATCDMSIVTENIVHFGCVTAGQAPGPTGDFDLARLTLIPHEDLADDLFPGNDNGVVTIVKDNGCELVDVFGHPVSGSINGGLTPECGNVTVTVRMLEGDLNLDCLVDVQDAQLMGFRYGAFFGSLLYDKWYDLEPALHDLDIDIKDIQKVSGRNGSTCQEPIPPQPPRPAP